jgi:hypothetical protein
VGQASKCVKYFKSRFYTLVIETNGTAIGVAENCHGTRRLWRVFLHTWQELCGVRAVSRYKFYRSQKSITGYKTVGEHWSSIAVQTITEPEIYQGAEIKLRAAARIRMQEPLEICLDAGAKQKP